MGNRDDKKYSMKNIALLGSTGSIGTQTLDVVSQFPDSFKVTGLAAGSNIQLLKQQVSKFHPKEISVKDERDAAILQKDFKKGNLKVFFGDEGIVRVATNPRVETVAVATSGLAGIKPTLAAIRAHKTVALATKEVLVSAGSVVITEIKKKKVKLLPIDSEHSAIFQCLEGKSTQEIATIYLTCSGGPFRTKTFKELKNVKASQALKHPTWNMGKKITIDSATLMNKGFEIIEAMWLFKVPLAKIKVIVHPQSVIHSAVEFVDGSIIAQLGPADMRLPIQHALFYPHERRPNNFKRFRFSDYPALSFEELDLDKFPCLALAYQAARLGGTCCAVLTAANDVAVEAFLKDELSFYGIPRVIETILAKHRNKKHPKIEEILESDLWARKTAGQLVKISGRGFGRR